MKLKISDEELDKLAESYSFATGYVGFRNGYITALAESQSKVDKLMQIVEMLRIDLQKLLPEVYCLYQQSNGERLDKIPEKHDSVKIKYDNAKESICETDKMLKELNQNKG